MNPENQLNQPKPNLKRIAEIFGKATYPTEKHFQYLQKDWENIEKGKISYPDIPDMEALLIEEDIPLSLLPDFNFMGLQFKLQKEWISEMNKGYQKDKSYYLELFQSLIFLQERNEGIKIKINSINNKAGISIQNPFLIEVIKKALIQHSKQRIGKSLNQKDMPIYLKQFKDFTKQSGRGDKKHSSFGINIYILKLYLQEFPELKDKSERKQNGFIFKFLKLWGLIDISDSYKEDIIRISLKNYLKSEKNQDYQNIRQRSQNPDNQ